MQKNSPHWRRRCASSETILTEEATKNAFVMPFISTILGYDVFNPLEVVPEFTADVGMKKGEKIDYAIVRDGEVQILIECKKSTEPLRSSTRRSCSATSPSPTRGSLS